MSKVKNQHFVPRFYLENFTNEKGKIFAYDLRTKKSFGSAVDNIASKKFFYDFEPLDEMVGDQLIEKSMSQFEGESATTIKKYIRLLKKGSLKNQKIQDRVDLAEYIIIQMERTVESRTIGEHFAMEMERQLKEKGVTDEQLKQSKLDAGSYDAKLQQLYGFFAPEMEDRIRSLCDRWWVFYDNQTKHKLYTSDHPAVGYTHRSRGFKAYEIYFPLTPRFAVSILIKTEFPEWADMDNQIMELTNTEYVKFYNHLILRNCNRQIYSCENDFRLASKILKEDSDLANPDRSRIGKS